MTTRILLPLALVGLLSVSAALAVTRSAAVPAEDGPPALPAGPVLAGAQLISATPFVLQVPATHVWQAGQPVYSSGLVLVLTVAERDLLARRQLAEPVLYVGAVPAERVNDGHLSGHLVAIVPSLRAGQQAHLFLGEPALPEQVTESEGAMQLARAVAAGLAPASLGSTGDTVLTFPDHGDLLSWCATLVAAYAPDEQDLAIGLLAPRLDR